MFLIIPTVHPCLGHFKSYFCFWFPSWMLLRISRFTAYSVVCIVCAWNDMWIFNLKNCVPSQYDLFILVALMLMYCLCAWSLEEFGARNSSRTWSGIICSVLYCHPYFILQFCSIVFYACLCGFFFLVVCGQFCCICIDSELYRMGLWSVCLSYCRTLP